MSDSFNIMATQNAVIHLPMATILVVAAYLASTRRSRHPEVSLLVTIANYRNRRAVAVQGQFVSETVIRERR